MKTYILYFAFYFIFYIIGAYATTDILRLLKNTSVPIDAPNCYCPICKNKINLINQLPIISYLKNKGKCFHCKNTIPIFDLFLEIFLFLSLSIISTCLHFEWIAFFFCIAIFEGTKFIFILIYGPREIDFIKNLFISLKNNIFIFLLLGILFLLKQII